MVVVTFNLLRVGDLNRGLASHSTDYLERQSSEEGILQNPSYGPCVVSSSRVGSRHQRMAYTSARRRQGRVKHSVDTKADDSINDRVIDMDKLPARYCWSSLGGDGSGGSANAARRANPLADVRATAPRPAGPTASSTTIRLRVCRSYPG